MALHLQVVLCLGKHGSDHLSERGIQEFIGQVYDFLGDPISYQELRALIREVVAVMLEHIVCSLSESRRDLSEEVHEEFFGQFRETKVHNLSWSPCVNLVNTHIS